jgi:AcrR family transcriptional regulator
VDREKASLRRAPKPGRGQQRVDRILDAAAEEFAEVGYERATTNAIARRAQTSVGSLYQFFPNKEAVLAALTDRYLGAMRAMHDRVLSDDATQLPMMEFYDRLVESIAAFQQEQPGFRNLFYGSVANPDLAKAAARLHQECVSRAEKAITARFPTLPQEQRQLYAAINVEVIKALIPLAAQRDEPGRERVLAEIKKLLLRYMNGAEEEARQSAG